MSNEDIAFSSEGQTEKLTKRSLPGWGFILIPLVIGGIAGFFYAVSIGGDVFLDYWDMDMIGYDLIDYFERHGEFPATEKWCDVLQGEGKNTQIDCYDSGSMNFPYALNKNIFGVEDLPNDMVVLFTGVTGWNSFGDDKLVRDCNRIKVFHANGEVLMYRKYQISSLKWRHDEDGVIAKRDALFLLTFFNILPAVLTLVLLVMNRSSLKIFLKLSLFVAIVSAVAGGYLAGAAEAFFYLAGYSGFLISPWIGGVWGFVIGAVFIIILGNVYTKYKGNVSMAGYGIVFGSLTGIAASCIVHGNLIIWYGEESFRYLIAGGGFGIIAGFLLGWISSGLIRLYKNHPVVAGIETDEKV